MQTGGGRKNWVVFGIVGPGIRGRNGGKKKGGRGRRRRGRQEGFGVEREKGERRNKTMAEGTPGTS